MSGWEKIKSVPERVDVKERVVSSPTVIERVAGAVWSVVS